MKQVGRALPHESAAAHVTGSAKYVDDLWMTTARVAHAWPVSSPHAHARVLEISATDAAETSGFLALLSAADVPAGTIAAGVPARVLRAIDFGSTEP